MLLNYTCIIIGHIKISELDALKLLMNLCNACIKDLV